MTVAAEVVPPAALPAAVGLPLTPIRWSRVCLSGRPVRGWLVTELLPMPRTPKDSDCSQVSETCWPGSSIPGLPLSRRVHVGPGLPSPEPHGACL